MSNKLKLNSRLKINTEREEINLEDFNENKIEIVGSNILSKQNLNTNQNKIGKINEDKKCIKPEKWF